MQPPKERVAHRQTALASCEKLTPEYRRVRSPTLLFVGRSVRYKPIERSARRPEMRQVIMERWPSGLRRRFAKPLKGL